MTRLSPISPPYVSVLVIAIISASLFIYLNIHDVGPTWLEPLVGGLATAIAASYIATTLITRKFREQEIDRQNRMRNTAYRGLKKSLQRHIQVLIEMYIATSEGPPENVPDNYQMLFSDDFEEQIQYLETSKKYPIVIEDMTWGVHIKEQIKTFQEDIDKILNLYTPWLDTEEVETLQNLRDSSFLSLLISISYIDLSESSELALMSMSDEISTHIELLLQIIEKYNDSEELDIQGIEDFNIWKENIAPSFGCGSSEIETVHPSDMQWVPFHQNDVKSRRYIDADKLDAIYED